MFLIIFFENIISEAKVSPSKLSYIVFNPPVSSWIVILFPGPMWFLWNNCVWILPRWIVCVLLDGAGDGCMHLHIIYDQSVFAWASKGSILIRRNWKFWTNLWSMSLQNFVSFFLWHILWRDLRLNITRNWLEKGFLQQLCSANTHVTDSSLVYVKNVFLIPVRLNYVSIRF